MFCTAAVAETVIGKTLAKKIRNTGAASETPNQRMATGIQAMGEIGRSTWIIGLKALKAQPNQPRSRPNGTPRSTARKNPQVTRNSEATMYLKSRPFSISSTMPRATSNGLGKRSLPESRTAPSQESRNAVATSKGRRTGVREGEDAFRAASPSGPRLLTFRLRSRGGNVLADGSFILRPPRCKAGGSLVYHRRMGRSSLQNGRCL